MVSKKRLQIIFVFLFAVGFLLLFIHSTKEEHQGIANKSENNSGITLENPIYYAVFSSNTPNGESYRGFDYAYYLPMTALAWERIGFRSITLIIGSRCEWENDPALNLILTFLESRHATVIFISAQPDYRTMLSQTARIFAVNMKEFPGRPRDFLITSDSDLWPLHKEHFLPRPHKDVLLVHSECCEPFVLNNKSYPMYPMSNIGATVSAWRQIINDNHNMIANDSASILNYFEEIFGAQARRPIVVGQETWYMDQQMVSIRLSEWITMHGNSSIYRMSDKGFSRLDRNKWEVDKLNQENFKFRFDAHLPEKGFLPIEWKSHIQPLIILMYGENSWEHEWCEKYTKVFLSKMVNYLEFSQLTL
uniref:Uncharacterized protein n=1 Tax=Daphnia galeata TaxID=27404 RepID=A0A8J2S4X8_9CRUS|nr:unnamed protein product [Daphnia galeata]